MFDSTETPLPFVSESGNWGYIGTDGNWLISPQFSKAYRFSEDRAVVKTGKKFYIIDPKGEMVTEKAYDACGYFIDQRCAVEVGDKWGYIDLDGEYIAEPQFREAKDFSEGLAPADTLWSEWDALHGYLDPDGNFAIVPRFVLASKFSEGLAYVLKENGRDESQSGYINKDGEYVIELEEFGQGKAFSGGIAPVSLFGRYGLIDKEGTWVVTPAFEFINSFSEGMARVKKGNNWGFIDNSGKLKISTQFGFVDDFSEGLAVFSPDPLLIRDQSGNPVSINHNRKFGYINNKGKCVIEPKYSKAESFVSGVAWVEGEDKFKGYIDKAGNILIYSILNF